MSNQEFYVSHDGEQLGPFNVATIVDMLQTAKLTPMDYIYNPESKDWEVIIQFPIVAEAMAAAKPATPPPGQHHPVEPAPPVAQAEPAKAEREYMKYEWYVLKGENKFGPFVFTDVIKMLQQGVVFEFDFAWHSGLEGWTRIAEVEDFKAENIKQLKDTLMPEISEVFFRRRHRRANYGGTILVHDNKSVWKGQAMEISAGGAGVVMENAMVVPGQNLYLHFKPGDGVPPFNAICEVVSKKYVENIQDKNQAVRYGLKFKSISEEAKNMIYEYTKTIAA